MIQELLWNYGTIADNDLLERYWQYYGFESVGRDVSRAPEKIWNGNGDPEERQAYLRHRQEQLKLALAQIDAQISRAQQKNSARKECAYGNVGTAPASPRSTRMLATTPSGVTSGSQLPTI